MIKSRSGHTITFDDADDADGGGELVVKDGGKGSSITLNARTARSRSAPRAT